MRLFALLKQLTGVLHKGATPFLSRHEKPFLVALRKATFFGCFKKSSLFGLLKNISLNEAIMGIGL